MSERHKIMIGAFLLTLALTLGVWQFFVLRGHQITVENLGSNLKSLQSIQSSLATDFQKIKSELTDIRQVSQQDYNVIFPLDADVTDLNRFLDDFAAKNNFESNPFFVSNLNYQSVLKAETHQILPFSMSVTTSKKNLVKFLSLIEDSGTLPSGTRLMSVEELSIVYPGEFGGAYEARLNLNAYFAQAQ